MTKAARLTTAHCSNWLKVLSIVILAFLLCHPNITQKFEGSHGTRGILMEFKCWSNVGILFAMHLKKHSPLHWRGRIWNQPISSWQRLGAAAKSMPIVLHLPHPFAKSGLWSLPSPSRLGFCMSYEPFWITMVALPLPMVRYGEISYHFFANFIASLPDAPLPGLWRWETSVLQNPWQSSLLCLMHVMLQTSHYDALRRWIHTLQFSCFIEACTIAFAKTRIGRLLGKRVRKRVLVRGGCLKSAWISPDPWHFSQQPHSQGANE